MKAKRREPETEPNLSRRIAQNWGLFLNALCSNKNERNYDNEKYVMGYSQQ